MSPSIAAESLLPIAPAPEKNRAVPPAGGQNSESFADVLDEELSTEDEPLTSAKPPENSEPKAVTVDPWTWLGFAQLAPPPSPTISSPPAIPVAASEGETPVLPSSSLNSSGGKASAGRPSLVEQSWQRWA